MGCNMILCDLMRCDLMNSLDFTLDEQRDVVKVMQELVGTFSNKKIILPVCFPAAGPVTPKKSSQKVSSPQRRYCGVVTNNGVEVFVEKNEEGRDTTWDSVTAREGYSSLKGMVFFEIEREKYFAVGGGREITIYNLRSDERVEIAADIESTKGSCFDCLSVVGVHGSLEQRLVAAHSRIGVVDVALGSLVGYRDYSLGDTDFFHKAYGKEHVKLAVRGEGVYVAEDKLLSEFGLDRTLQMQRVYAENIYALTTDTTKNVYVGMMKGMIYRNSEKFFSVGNSLATIFKMQCGTYQQKEGIFFNTYTNRLYSPVYFTDGSGQEVVSVGGLLESVVDFQIDSKGRLFSLQNDRATKTGVVEVYGLGDHKLHSQIAFNGKGKTIQLYGGI